MAFTVIVFVSLLMIFPLAVSALPDNAQYIASFEDTVDGFTAFENTVSVEKTEFYLADGQSVSCLEVGSDYVSIDSLRSVVKNFDTPADFSGYRKFTYSIFVPEYLKDANAVYYARLIIRSDDGREFESIDIATAGQWTPIVTDISTFDGRSAVSSVEIALIVDTSVETMVSDSFFIDDIFVSDMADLEMIERFLFDGYTVEGGTALVSDDKSKISIFSSSESGVTFSAPVSMPNLEYDVNCLRLKLANYTDGDHLTLYYSVMDGRAVSESKSVIVPIEPNSDARFYYVPIDGVKQIRQISLLFGESIGRVELISLNVTYMTADKFPDIGVRVSCRIDSSLKSLSFSGEISRETALENQNGKIKIYKVDGDISDFPELDGMTPVAESSMTTKFDITWHIPGELELTMLERYVAVISAENGEYLFISPHVYVENPEALAKSTYPFPIDAKGFYTDDLSVVTASDTGITVLEFDMQSAFLDRTERVAYTYNGNVYYLNSQYISKIEKIVNMMSDNGTSVLIRLTNRKPSNVTLPLSGDASADDYLGAVSSFIADKWVSKGLVCGVIMGYCENRIGKGDNIGEMVTEAAEDLKKISVNLIKKNSDARAYLSVTDLISRDILTNSEELPLLEYLDLFFGAASVYGKNYFGLCIESPYYTENHVLLPYRKDTIKDGTFVSVSDNGELKALIKKYGELKYNLIFCDEVYKNSHEYIGSYFENFVIGFYTAFFADEVDGYIAVAEGKSVGYADPVKRIGTTGSDDFWKDVFAVLKMDSLSDLIENYDESKLPKKLYNSGSVAYTLPEKIMGQYRLYEFKNAVEASAVKANYYGLECNLINDDEVGPVLAVEIKGEDDSLAPSFFGITADYEYTENFEFMSWIGVDLKLNGRRIENGKKVPVRLVLTADNEIFEVEAEVSVGKWTKAYFNIEGFKNSKNTKMMQIIAKDEGLELSELLIKEIVGLSEEYNDESLESVVQEERLKKRDPDRGMDYSPYLWLGGGLLVTVGTCAAVVLLSRRKRVEK